MFLVFLQGVAILKEYSEFMNNIQLIECHHESLLFCIIEFKHRIMTLLFVLQVALACDVEDLGIRLFLTIAEICT
jgi:hypothetical protein